MRDLNSSHTLPLFETSISNRLCIFINRFEIICAVSTERAGKFFRKIASFVYIIADLTAPSDNLLILFFSVLVLALHVPDNLRKSEADCHLKSFASVTSAIKRVCVPRSCLETTFALRTEQVCHPR